MHGDEMRKYGISESIIQAHIMTHVGSLSVTTLVAASVGSMLNTYYFI